MIILLSPSKTLEYKPSKVKIPPTRPALLQESEKLIDLLRALSEEELQALMGISQKLAALNHQRYLDFTTPFTPENATPAIFTFQGDVYEGLQASQLSEDVLLRAQQQLRMLSGLYGLLRPFDLMQPYRLEMGTKLSNPRGKNLYSFWAERITQAINEALAEQEGEAVINLASQEYFKAVQPNALQGQLITPIFKEQKGNDFKVIGLFAKRARGMMARFILEENIRQVKDIKGFSVDGYRFEAELSKGNDWVFARRQKAAA
jgi:hypothetical protein